MALPAATTMRFSPSPRSTAAPIPPPFLDTVGALYGQGVWPSQIYILKVAASRVYCPDRIATPIQVW